MLILSKNTLTEVSRITFDHVSRHCGPAKWTHKINHHNITVRVILLYQRFSHVTLSEVPIGLAAAYFSFIEQHPSASNDISAEPSLICPNMSNLPSLCSTIYISCGTLTTLENLYYFGSDLMLSFKLYESRTNV